MIKKLSILATDYSEESFSNIRSGWRSGDTNLDKILPVIFQHLTELDEIYIRTNNPNYWEIIVKDAPSLLEVKKLLQRFQVKSATNPYGDRHGVLISVDKK